MGDPGRWRRPSACGQPAAHAHLGAAGLRAIRQAVDRPVHALQHSPNRPKSHRFHPAEGTARAAEEIGRGSGVVRPAARRCSFDDSGFSAAGCSRSTAQMTTEDLDRPRRGTTLVTCPRSNGHLRGAPPIEDSANYGVRSRSAPTASPAVRISTCSPSSPRCGRWRRPCRRGRCSTARPGRVRARWGSIRTSARSSPGSPGGCSPSRSRQTPMMWKNGW